MSPSPRLTGQLLQKFVQPVTILHVLCQEAQAMASDSDEANVWLNKTLRVNARIVISKRSSQEQGPLV